jgi:hypothetical protein
MLFVYTGSVVYVCTCDQVMITWSDFGGIDNKNICLLWNVNFNGQKMFGTPKRELRSQLSKYDRTEKCFPCQNVDGFRFSRMRMSLAPGRISVLFQTPVITSGPPIVVLLIYFYICVLSSLSGLWCCFYVLILHCILPDTVNIPTHT